MSYEGDKRGLKPAAKSITSCCKEVKINIYVHFSAALKKQRLSQSVFVMLTSSTNGKTAKSGNRETVIFINVSLRVCKTFCRRKKKTV